MLRAWSCALVLSSVAAFGLAACQGCGVTTPDGVASPDNGDAAAKPTLRLYLLSTVAGAIEPCGCTKDQLGGVDHLAALVGKDAAVAKGTLVVGAGPLLFMEPELKGDSATQHTWKAEAMAQAVKDIGLVGWAPGFNDWAAGSEALGKYAAQAGAQLLAANLDGVPAAARAVMRDIGGIKVGIVGVADPKHRTGRLPDGVNARPAVEGMRAGLDEAKSKGARVLVGVAAMPRGEALRLADNFPELHVLLVGKPLEAGEVNDAQKSPQLVGSTLVVEAANHLQTVGVVDLFVREPSKADKPVVFADSGGVARAEELIALSNRIRDLEQRINSWENDKHVKPEDLTARKADLQRLRAEKAKAEAPSAAPAGSFFRYSSVEVREHYGAREDVAGKLLSYYKRVNEHNKTAFAGRKPPAPDKGKAGFVGVAVCTECHDEERKVWDATPHAHAYATLEKQFKEFNLDCVGCHVTGYEKPGGSAVTGNEKLQNVGCEECHGPGSLHAKSQSPKDIILKPDPQACVSACHHPPHVEGFDAVAKMKLVLGPGHGPDEPAKKP